MKRLSASLLMMHRGFEPRLIVPAVELGKNLYLEYTVLSVKQILNCNNGHSFIDRCSFIFINPFI